MKLIALIILLSAAVCYANDPPFVYIEKLDEYEAAHINQKYLVTEPDPIEIIPGEAELNIDDSIPAVEIDHYGVPIGGEDPSE